MKEFARRLSSFFLDIFQIIVMALSFFVISYLFLFQPHQVKGNSMLPNFYDGDFLLTDKISYRFGEPKRGEVVIFKAPPSEPCAEQECEYIKRVLALPRERIRVAEGSLFVNEQEIKENYLTSEIRTREGNYFQEGATITLAEDEYLLLGDNRPYSRDGREFGPIKRKFIIGKAWLRYWPLNRSGLVAEAKYH